MMNSGYTEQAPVTLTEVLRPKPALISGISDYNLSLIVPVVTHWLAAAVYETIEYFNLFQKYKIHTTKEERAKNTISRLECLRGVLVVQVRCSVAILTRARLIPSPRSYRRF
jgi:sphinganine C4-monooxygenase